MNLVQVWTTTGEVRTYKSPGEINVAVKNNWLRVYNDTQTFGAGYQPGAWYWYEWSIVADEEKK